MKSLRIVIVCLILIAGILTAIIFKKEEFTPVGIAIAQDVAQQEKEFIFDDEMPRFSEETEAKEETLDKNKKSAVKSVKTNNKESVSVNINTAEIKDWVLLPGIGEAAAQNIIDYRKKFGNFTGKDDLKKVKGIGEKKFKAIKDFLKL